MHKIWLVALGLGFMGVGLFGFTCGSLPETLAIDPLHNLLYVFSGLLALASVMLGASAMHLYARVFGGIYLLLAIGGLFSPTRFLCEPFGWYAADAWFHFGLALLLLWLGFARCCTKSTRLNDEVKEA
jgi:hypothetical protein